MSIITDGATQIDVRQRDGESDRDYKKRLVQIHDALKMLRDKRRYRAIDFFRPYPKQQDFFDMGLLKRERLLSAGNQLGKTEAGAAEMAYHLTGEYPDDWLGRRFDRPVKAWAAGETGLLVRDVQQKKLFGEPGVDELLGTGFIPREAIVGKPTLARGVTDAYDTVVIKHRSGGNSILRFKSYEQGRKKFQGDTIDIIWCDEEPDEEIYSECLTRTNATGGLVYTTFTPLQGATTLYNRFASEPSPDRGMVNITIHDASALEPYSTMEKRMAIINSYPVHERAARSSGTPMMGSGRIFTYPEESIMEPAIKYVPPQWFKLWAIDFGIAENHKFAAALLLWDKDFDIIHLHHCFKVADQTPIMHLQQMRNTAENVPVVWPHDGGNREKSNGEELILAYRAVKPPMIFTSEHATFETGGYSTEAGIAELDERMKTGRFKVAAHLSEWFEEYRNYHRKDGLIVRKNDDLLSATRIGNMARRYAKAVIMGKRASRQNNGLPLIAETGGLWD